MTVRSILSATQLTGPSNPYNRLQFIGGRSFGLFLAFLLLALGIQPLTAQSYQDIYNFGGSASGCCPPSPSQMAEGRSGNIYGTSPTGGTANKGVIFQMTSAGVLTTLFSFDGTHGSSPVGGLTLGADGNLYGTTEFGGANSYGTIFKITPAGVLTVLYNFTANTDGGYPIAPLTLAADGNFYGTSYPGYAFKLSPAGVFQVITKTPTTTAGALVQAKNGSFYGTTQFGGTASAGTVYRITGNTATIIHSFLGPEGSFPIGGLVQGDDGNLYGTTTFGGTVNAGVIYRITPAGVYTVMVSFDNVHTLNGYQANAGLIAGADGNLYGATVWGGRYGYGVIFSLTTAGTYSVLYNFSVATGDGAYATPMQHTSGRIFGTTTRGGVGGMGVVYGFNDAFPSFLGLTNGSGPVGKQIGILGRGFSQATSVEFNGTPASFHVASNTYLTATVPSGETGFIRVNMPSGDLVSGKIFYVIPRITAVSPTTGKVGATVELTGTGLIQSEAITVGGVQVTSFTVNSDASVHFRVPTGAKTGPVVLTTPGGKSSSPVFTVTE